MLKPGYKGVTFKLCPGVCVLTDINKPSPLMPVSPQASGVKIYFYLSIFKVSPTGGDYSRIVYFLRS